MGLEARWVGVASSDSAALLSPSCVLRSVRHGCCSRRPRVGDMAAKVLPGQLRFRGRPPDWRADSSGSFLLRYTFRLCRNGVPWDAASWSAETLFNMCTVKLCWL
ncbi:unnamed protein product [Urochloa humidicola]